MDGGFAICETAGKLHYADLSVVLGTRATVTYPRHGNVIVPHPHLR